MKTTIDMADALMAEAKRLARREHTTLRAIIEEALRRLLAQRQAKSQRFALKQITFGGKGLRAGIRSWDQMRELAYEGHGG